MALKDAVITVKGDQAVVRKVEIMKNQKGEYVLICFGESKTSDGKLIGLDAAQEIAAPGVKALDDIWARALPVLRKANGLE